jgi:A/G-specific adenine glycosylase
MAKALIPKEQSRDFNQALMEFGALVCGKKPRCAICPLSRFCQAHRLGITAERPIPGKKTNYSTLEIVAGVLVQDSRIFIQKRLESGVWAGLWEFPGGRLEEGETPEQAVVREFAEETEFRVRPAQYLGLVRHAYTRYKIAMHCFICVLEPEPARPASRALFHAPGLDALSFPEPKLHAATEYRWVEAEALDDFALPAGHRKLVDAWLPELLCPQFRL